METDLGNVSPNPKGTYTNEESYEYLDLVEYQGGSYLCTAELGTKTTGIAPVPGKIQTHGRWLHCLVMQRKNTSKSTQK